MGIKEIKEIFTNIRRISEDPITQATHNSKNKYAVGIDVSEIFPVLEGLFGEELNEIWKSINGQVKSNVKRKAYLTMISSKLPHLDQENIINYAEKGIIYCTITGSFGEVEQKVQDIKQDLFEKHPYANIGIVALRPNKEDKAPIPKYHHKQSQMYQKIEFMLQSATRDNLAEVKKL